MFKFYTLFLFLYSNHAQFFNLLFDKLRAG